MVLGNSVHLLSWDCELPVNFTLLCSIEVILLGQSTAKMKLYSLPCLLEGDICRFQTIQLEFPKAKEILEMHMILVHGRPESRDKSDSCD